MSHRLRRLSRPRYVRVGDPAADDRVLLGARGLPGRSDRQGGDHAAVAPAVRSARLHHPPASGLRLAGRLPGDGRRARSSGPATGSGGVRRTAQSATCGGPGMFDTRCGDGGCHLDRGRPGEAGCLPEPAAGLSLCAGQAWAALVDVPSRQTDGMRLVRAGDSARSYLLRKLLPGIGRRCAPLPPWSDSAEPARPAADPTPQLRAVAALDRRRRPPLGRLPKSVGIRLDRRKWRLAQAYEARRTRVRQPSGPASR